MELPTPGRPTPVSIVIPRSEMQSFLRELEIRKKHPAAQQLFDSFRKSVEGYKSIKDEEKEKPPVFLVRDSVAFAMGFYLQKTVFPL